MVENSCMNICLPSFTSANNLSIKCYFKYCSMFLTFHCLTNASLVHSHLTRCTLPIGSSQNMTRVCLMRWCCVFVVVEGPEHDQGLSDEEMLCCCCRWGVLVKCCWFFPWLTTSSIISKYPWDIWKHSSVQYPNLSFPVGLKNIKLQHRASRILTTMKYSNIKLSIILKSRNPCI